MRIYVIDQWDTFAETNTRRCFPDADAADAYDRGNFQNDIIQASSCVLTFGNSKVQTAEAFNLLLRNEELFEGEYPPNGGPRESAWEEEQRKARRGWHLAGSPPRGISAPPHPTVSNVKDRKARAV